MDRKESLFEELFLKSSSNKDFFWYFSDFIVSDDKYKEMKKSSYCFLIFQMDGKESLFEELFKKSKDFFWYLSDFIVSDDKFMTIFYDYFQLSKWMEKNLYLKNF